MLLGCGLRRAELSALEVEDMEVRQGHWAIVDLIGKGSRVRTVPMPMWVKEAVDRWIIEAKVAKAGSSGPSADMERHGEKASLRTSSGTSFGGVPNGRSSITSLHIICVGPVQSCAIPRAAKSLRSDISAANRTLRSQ